jgi:hypothetical protein
MSVPPEVMEVIRRWLKKAEHDVEAARRIMGRLEDCPYDTVCFHCQQAVETAGYVRSVASRRWAGSPCLHLFPG